MNRKLSAARAVLAAAAIACVGLVAAHPLSGAPDKPQLKFSTPMPPGVAAPDKLDTRFGTLTFLGGMPDQASADKLCDNLDAAVTCGTRSTRSFRGAA